MNTAKAAGVSEPVAGPTWIPETGHIADVPDPETGTPVRRSGASRSPTT
ncbi:hypothetical protein ACFWVP_22500 [Streptomyces sp. NPDC058637]